jgi:thiol-disulfide isomerase/thioredoxin
MRARLLVLSTMLVASLVLLANRSRVQAWASRSDPSVQAGRPAPELPSDARSLEGRPVRLAELRGRVVVLHFWTFACGNCEHMLPSYSAWDVRYRERGLRVVGVHTPELEHERDLGRLRAFVKQQKLAWTVVPDSDYVIWDRFGVRAWPTIFVIDRKGSVAGVFVGDDRAQEIETLVQRLL